jgi:hypothetical protein
MPRVPGAARYFVTWQIASRERHQQGREVLPGPSALSRCHPCLAFGSVLLFGHQNREDSLLDITLIGHQVKTLPRPIRTLDACGFRQLEETGEEHAVEHRDVGVLAACDAECLARAPSKGDDLMEVLVIWFLSQSGLVRWVLPLFSGP